MAGQDLHLARRAQQRMGVSHCAPNPFSFPNSVDVDDEQAVAQGQPMGQSLALRWLSPLPAPRLPLPLAASCAASRAASCLDSM